MKRAALLALALVAAGASAAGADPVDVLAPGSRPSPGVGGDPFLSPLRDGAGWWADAAAGSDGDAGIRYESSRPLPGDRGRSFELGRSEWRMHAGRDHAIGARTLRLALTRAEPDWTTGTGGGPVRVAGFETNAGAAVAARLIDPATGLTVGALLPAWSELRGPEVLAPGVGLRWQRGGRLAAQGSWSRSHEHPALGAWRGDRHEELALDARRELLAVDVEAGGGPIEAAQFDYRRALLLPGRSGEAAGRPTMDAVGWLVSWQSGVVLRPADRVRVLLRRTESNGDGAATAFWLGQRFARVNYARGRLGSWLGAVDRESGRHRVLADVERLEAHGGARFTIESWPFTDLWGDLLGARQYALGRFEVEGWRAHVGVERRARGRFRWRAGLAAYDFLTDATLISWQSAFLGLGVVNREESALRWRRVQLGALSFGLTLKAVGFECAADVRQFVFAKAFERSRADTPAATPPEAALGTAAPGAEVGHARWPGGTSFSIALRRSR